MVPKKLPRLLGNNKAVAQTTMLSLHTPATVSILPSNWVWRRLDTVCDGIFDCPHSTPILTNKGPFIVRSQDVRTGILRIEESGHVTEETYKERISRAEPRHGDLFYSREGTYFGIAAEVPSGVQVCLGQRMVLLRPFPSIVYFRYLRYWLNSPVMASHIHGYRDGTVAERLNLPTIRGLPVALPPINEQSAIAFLLGALDGKIEINRQMNEILEAMARLFFKDWFVDFGPTRAKAEGRPAYLAPELWSLFPDALDDDDKPVGWSIKPLSAVIELIGGGTPKTSIAEYWDGSIPWFSVVDAPDTTDVYVIQTEKSITLLGLKNSSTRLIPLDSTIITARGTVGKIALVGVEMAMNQSCYAITGKTGWSNHFIYFILKNAIQTLKANTHGSVFDTITRATFDAVSLCCPTQNIALAFDHTVQDLMKQIKSNLFENDTLAKTRDLLLPKLMSGEIRLLEAQAQVEKVLT